MDKFKEIALAILKNKQILSFLIGALIVAVAGVFGVAPEFIKESICKSQPPVTIVQPPLEEK